nr:hypothetical protein Iba_chr09aCG7380 [Ipomoea batatas]GMD37221.1 hypothetical protein Iba_chr09eCG7310 [Ipomoea batatas]
MFIKTISETARANKALCFSNAVSSSPLSLPSVPSKSITRVQGSIPTHRAIQIPFVVCDLERKASISLKFVWNR